MTHLAAVNALQLVDAASVHQSEAPPVRRGPGGPRPDDCTRRLAALRGRQPPGDGGHEPAQSADPRGRDGHDPDDGFRRSIPTRLINSLVVLAGLSDTDTAANKRGVLHATSHLSFGYSALGGVTHAAAIAVGTTSALSLGQAAYSIRESATVSALQLGDLATVVSSKPASDQVAASGRRPRSRWCASCRPSPA